MFLSTDPKLSTYTFQLAKYPVSAIHILKCHGKSSMESHMVRGFALAESRAAQGMPSVVKGAKIALLDFSLQRHKLQLGVQVRGDGQVRLGLFQLTGLILICSTCCGV